MSRPTKPAGCFLQLIGGVSLIVGAVLIGMEQNLVAGIPLCVIGVGLMAWGRLALKK